MGRIAAHTVLMTPVKHPALAGLPTYVYALIAAKCQENDNRIWAPSVAESRWLRTQVGLSHDRLRDIVRMLEWAGRIRIYDRAGRTRNRPQVYQVLDPAKPLTAGDAATLTLNPHPARVHQRHTRDLWSDVDDARHSAAIADAQQQYQRKRETARKAVGTTWTPRIVSAEADAVEADAEGEGVPF